MRTLPPDLTHATLQKSMLRLSSKHDQAKRSGRCKRFMACTRASRVPFARMNGTRMCLRVKCHARLADCICAERRKRTPGVESKAACSIARATSPAAIGRTPDGTHPRTGRSGRAPSLRPRAAVDRARNDPPSAGRAARTPPPRSRAWRRRAPFHPLYGCRRPARRRWRRVRRRRSSAAPLEPPARAVSSTASKSTR